MKVFACALIVLAGPVVAWGQACCECCGCQAPCQKVCRVVCEIKQVPKNVYDCECEEFCVPGKSEHCVEYDECGCKRHVYKPTCGCVRTRVKLVKSEEMVEKVIYKCVVQDVCCQCAQQATAPTTTAARAATSPAGEVQRAGFQAPEAPRATPTDEAAAAPRSKLDWRRLFDPLLGK